MSSIRFLAEYVTEDRAGGSDAIVEIDVTGGGQKHVEGGSDAVVVIGATGGGGITRVAVIPATPVIYSLGCGEWHLMLEDSEGQTVAEIPWNTFAFGRVLRDMSQCYVSLAGTGCCEFINEVMPWVHQITIYRDDDPQPAWNGPVISTNFSHDSGRIDARDTFYWLERRVLPHNRDFAHKDASSVVFKVLAEDAFASDPVYGVYIHAVDSGVLVSRQYFKRDFIYAADALRELARSSMEFTVRGREIFAGGLAEAFEPLLITDADVRQAAVARYGTQFMTEAIVMGKSYQNDYRGREIKPYGRAQSGRSRWPLVQQVFTESEIKDKLSLVTNAERRVKHSQPAPLTLSATLQPEANMRFKDLIPGRWADVRLEEKAGCKLPIQMLLMNSVSVNVNAAEDGVNEAVTTTYIPTGEDAHLITESEGGHESDD